MECPRRTRAMSCHSLGPNNFWSSQIILDQTKNNFSLLNFAFWSMTKTFKTYPKQFGLVQNRFGPIEVQGISYIPDGEMMACASASYTYCLPRAPVFPCSSSTLHIWMVWAWSKTKLQAKHIVANILNTK